MASGGFPELAPSTLDPVLGHPFYWLVETGVGSEVAAQVQGTWSRQPRADQRQWAVLVPSEPQAGSSLQSQEGGQSRVGVGTRLFARHQETQGWGKMEAGVHLGSWPEGHWAVGLADPPPTLLPPHRLGTGAAGVPGPGAEGHPFPETAHRSWRSAGVRTGPRAQGVAGP